MRSAWPAVLLSMPPEVGVSTDPTQEIQPRKCRRTRKTYLPGGFGSTKHEGAEEIVQHGNHCARWPHCECAVLSVFARLHLLRLYSIEFRDCLCTWCRFWSVDYLEIAILGIGSIIAALLFLHLALAIRGCLLRRGRACRRRLADLTPTPTPVIKDQVSHIFSTLALAGRGRGVVLRDRQGFGASSKGS